MAGSLVVGYISPATIGGILLILGSFFVMKGDIFKSVFTFFIADCMWCLLAYNSGDKLGLCFTITGMLLGVYAYIKMNRGDMRKTLDL